MEQRRSTSCWSFVWLFFLFDKVVTAGKLFYDCARRNCNEYARKKKRNGEDDTHTEGNTATVVFGIFYVYMI